MRLDSDNMLGFEPQPGLGGYVARDLLQKSDMKQIYQFPVRQFN